MVILKGKAAKWLTRYLETRKPDPAKAARAQRHMAAGKRVKGPPGCG